MAAVPHQENFKTKAESSNMTGRTGKRKRSSLSEVKTNCDDLNYSNEDINIP